MPKTFLCRDWTDSLKVNALDAHAERFFLRLMMKCDDFGIFPADPLPLLKSALFPLLTDIRATDIPRWLAACEQAGLVRCYVAANSRKYIEVLNFKQRRQWMKSEHPPPQGQIGLELDAPKKIESAPVRSRSRSRSRSRREEKQKHATENHAERPSCDSSSPPLREENPKPENIGIKSDLRPLPSVLTKCAPPVAKLRREMWQLLNDEKTLTDRIKLEKDKQQPDRDLITALIATRTHLREEMKTVGT